jgi:hypothetical protein
MVLQLLLRKTLNQKKLGISYGEFADQVELDEPICFHEPTLMP